MIFKRPKNLIRTIILMTAVLAAVAIPAGYAATGQPGAGDKAPLMSAVDKWGVQPVVLRLTAADHFIDFRYKVVDAQKAKAMLKRPVEAYLIDEKTGARLPVPETKLGPMKANAVEPKVGRNYTVLFSNVNKAIARNSQVTVVIGDFRVEHLVVE